MAGAVIASNVEQTRQILETIRPCMWCLRGQVARRRFFAKSFASVKANRPEVQVVVVVHVRGRSRIHRSDEPWGLCDFIALPYRSSEIISVVDGAYRPLPAETER